MKSRFLAAALLAGLARQAMADPAEILSVRALPTGPGTWQFDVEVRHPDSGWEHYADGWEVVAPDGKILGTRVLLHPHMAEQPFTRSLSGVAIPDSVAEVTLLAHCSRDGYEGTRSVTVKLMP